MNKAYATVLLLAAPAIFVACGNGSSSTGTGGSGGSSGTTSSTKASTGTGTTSSTSATGTPSATSSTGSGPITCSGSYTNVPKGECDLLQQDCMNNDTCVVAGGGGGAGGAGSSTTACASPAGLKAVGSQCTMDSECQKGLFCFDVCTPVCCPDNDQPCNGGKCNLQINIQGTQDFFMVCTFAQQCTLFMNPSGCPTGQDCHPDNGIATCVKPSGANVPEGGTCSFINDCGNMQACVSPAMGQPAVCRYLCTPGSSAAAGLGGCPSGQTCQATTIFNIDNTGICHP